MQKIFDQIQKEREYQKGKWGTDADLNVNTFNDWVSYISHWSTKWFPGGFAPYDSETVEDFKRSMLVTATLAVAALEALEAIEAGETDRPDLIK